MAIVISGVNNNDKITAADGTIDLLSGVSYASTITAPGFTASNNITAASINVGSNIQLGNAGVVTATTFVGNLTGNVNSSSVNLLFQIGGSEKLRLNTNGEIGILGANYGTSGQVLTSQGAGNAVTWSTINGTTINNNANNRLITGSGTANTLNAESNVLYDGTNFGIGKAPSRTLDVEGKIRSSEAVCFGNNSSTPSEGAAIYRPADSSLAFVTNDTERVRIVSTGGVGINTDKVRNTRNVSIAGVTRDYTNSGTDLVDAGGIILQPTISLPSTGQAYPGIFWSGNTAALGRARAGIMGVAMSNNDATDIVFLSKLNAGGAGISPTDESMRITYNGKVGINSTTPQQTLDVRGSINGGSENQPFQRFHDSHGNQRTTKHYFRCTKGGTTIYDILTVDLNTNFHQALVIIYYGTRIQAVADSVTYPVNKVMGVNRFNGGNVQFNKITVMQDGNAATHADIDAVATSSTQYRIRLTFSGTAGGSSFCGGYVEIIGLGPGTDGAFYSLAHGYGITR